MARREKVTVPDAQFFLNFAVDRVKSSLPARAFGGGVILRTAMAEILARPGRGRIYVREDGSVHRASRPFEPPVNDSGEFGQGWIPRVTLMNGIPSPTITNNQSLARWLAKGTDKMEPRPFHDKVVKKAWPKIKNLYYNGKPYMIP